MYIVAVSGSHNKNGNTAFLLGKVLEYCRERGAQTEIISAHDAILSARTPFCTCCQSPCEKVCYKGTLLDEAFDKIERADFVLFGSPVYFGSMTAQLKAFFDKTRYARSNKKWLGKPMAAISVGATKYGGQERTVDHIQSCALVSGMTVIGNGSTLGMGHFGVSAHREAANDEYALAQCKSLAEAIISALS